MNELQIAQHISQYFPFHYSYVLDTFHRCYGSWGLTMLYLDEMARTAGYFPFPPAVLTPYLAETYGNPFLTV